jgi:cytochrome P450
MEDSKLIESSIDDTEDSQHNRLTQAHRSMGAKKGWMRHRSSYSRANRKKERDSMNKSFRNIMQEAKALINEEITKDDVFELNCEISFKTISGAIGVKVDKEDGNISLSTALIEKGNGNYKLEVAPSTQDAYKQVYENLKDDINTLCANFDNEINQVLIRYGLKPTN